MMHRSVLLLVLACPALTGNVDAQAAADEASPEATREAVEQGARTPLPPRPSQQPEPTFNPSEKIRADSAVSFPVDI